MKKLFGFLALITTLVTLTVMLIDASTPVQHQETQQQAAPQTNTMSVEVVGWEGCTWCDKLKRDVFPRLRNDGVQVKYLDINEWNGPPVIKAPTIFILKSGKIVATLVGFTTAKDIEATIKDLQ